MRTRPGRSTRPAAADGGSPGGPGGLPRGQVPVALATFNGGVELGQLALLAVALPIVLRLRKKLWFRDQGVKALSAGVTLAGVTWFVVRVAGL